MRCVSLALSTVAVAAALASPARELDAQPTSAFKVCPPDASGGCFVVGGRTVTGTPDGYTLEIYLKVLSESVVPLFVRGFHFGVILDPECNPFPPPDGEEGCSSNDFVTGPVQHSAVGNVDRGRYIEDGNGDGEHDGPNPPEIAEWTEVYPDDYHDLDGYDRMSSYYAMGPYALSGCSPRTIGPEYAMYYAYRTCEQEGFDGWLRLAFPGIRKIIGGESVPMQPNEFGFSLEYLTFELSEPSSCFISAGPGPMESNCAVSPYAVPSAVPEPATMVLLGTGLAGIGAAARRRRSRRRD